MPVVILHYVSLLISFILDFISLKNCDKVKFSIGLFLLNGAADYSDVLTLIIAAVQSPFNYAQVDVLLKR